jgi:hypothetical protein
VKRSGRDEPVWIVIHIRMETTQGISLYSYLYLKLAKNALFLFLSFMFFLLQSQRTRGQNRFCPEVGEAEKVAQIMHTHLSKCKNDKIKKETLVFYKRFHLRLSKCILIKSNNINKPLLQFAI